MLRTGDEYRESIRDGREVFINGERVEDVPTHPAFKPIVDARARIYDMAHEEKYRDIMSYAVDGGDGGNERNCMAYRPPKNQQDWHDKRRAVNAVMWDLGGVVMQLRSVQPTPRLRRASNSLTGNPLPRVCPAISQQQTMTSSSLGISRPLPTLTRFRSLPGNSLGATSEAKGCGLGSEFLMPLPGN